MSIVVPPQDLAPSVASRIVTLKFADLHEGPVSEPGTVTFVLPGDLRVPADDVIIRAGAIEVHLDANGEGQVRLPTHDPDAVGDGVGNDWYLLVKKSWSQQVDMIRVPAGTGPISLADINPVVEVTPAMGQWLITAAGVEIIEGASWGATVAVAGGVATFRFTVPTAVATAIYHRGVLASGTDLNTLTAPSHNGIYSMSGSNTYPNSPFPAGVAFSLIVENNGLGVVTHTAVRYGTGETQRRHVTNFYSNPIAWAPWAPAARLATTETGSGTIDLDSARTTQDILIPNASVTVVGWPAGLPRSAAHVQVRSTSTGVTFMQLQTYGPSGKLLTRQTASIGTSPFPWSEWLDLTAPPAQPGALAGIANAVLLEDWSRRRGGRKRIPTAAVALRFDHGLANFDSKIRPLLEARGLPYSLALNSGNWGNAENSGITASIVNGWVLGGLCEVWNHGRTHIGSATESVWQAEIGTGLTELRAQIPAAQIDGFVIPGTGGVGYGAFGSGQAASEFFTTPAGRYILETHAVSTGYIPGTQRRILDGLPRQGQFHFTMDTATLAQVQEQVTAAEAEKSGLQLMLHPSVVDTSSSITTATVTAIFDYLVAERTAGRLRILGAYDLMLADAA